VGFEESVWVRPKGGKYAEDIYVSTHVDDCLICCKSTATMSKFKQELLTKKETQTEWRSKWGLFGWANARRGAQWVRKEKPPFSRGRPRHFQLVGLPTFCETASATFR
jgi:hypothetical protein